MPDESSSLVQDLIRVLRGIDQGSLNAIADPALRPVLSAERESLWLKAELIGKRLKDLGGVELMQRAVREARRVNARMSEALEDSWSSRVKGYERVRWLP
ncbi:MAG: hypothetical protein WC728_17530 [Elusimicrobiota bacterium]